MGALFEGHFVVIDIRRARERVLYEEYLARLQSSSSVSQQLLFPERITLSEEEYELLEQYEVSLAALGFDLRFEGNGVVDVHGLPSNVALESMESLLYELLQSFAEPIEVEQLRREQTALVMARNALKGSPQMLDEEQATQLLAQLAACTNYSFSPSGKAVFGAWSLEELRAKLG